MKFHVAKLTARSLVYQHRAHYFFRLVMKLPIQRNENNLKNHLIAFYLSSKSRSSTTVNTNSHLQEQEGI